MSEQLVLPFSVPSVSCAEGSPARTCHRQAEGPVSLASAPGSGTNSGASSKRSRRRSSSSKTSQAVPGVGCPTCGETCTCWATEPVPSRFLPSTSARPITADECSCLLPTPTASNYGSSNNGCPGDGRQEYATKGTLSLRGMARRGLLPTPTVNGNYSVKGRWDRNGSSGDGLGTAVVPGPLSPRFVEWLMGFPDDWTDCGP